MARSHRHNLNAIISTSHRISLMTGTTNPDHPKFLRPPLDAYAYLADVITAITNRHPQSRLHELLPWNWAAANIKDIKQAA
jgi:IS66 C-terminal element